MSTNDQTVYQAVWLDPMRALKDEDCARLAESGLQPLTINMLSDLPGALTQAQVVVVRLMDTVDLYKEVSELIRTMGFNVPVICRVDRRNLSLTVEAMAQGALHVAAADDWTPASWTVAMGRLTRAMADRTAASEKTKSPRATKPRAAVFVDPASQHLLALAQRVAQTEVTALLVGPTGSGKEVLARVLHESSTRAKGPFVALNCAALPEHLIEDLLFGHDKGAFTGALKDHKGLFEQAQGGTIFLDEIGEMPMQLQSKLLRVLQERTMTRLGGQNTVDLDVRVVAATNKDLREAMQQREFREDLYFRISTFRLTLLPLASRKGDILPLVAQLLVAHGRADTPYNLSDEAQGLLLNYPWPGNVRELENVVQRAVVLCANGFIEPEHLLFDEYQTNTPPVLTPATVSAPITPDAALSPSPSPSPAVPSMPTAPTNFTDVFAQARPVAVPVAVEAPAEAVDLQDAVKKSEHQVISAALQNTDSRLEAAKLLGISPRTLRYKMAQLRERGVNVNMTPTSMRA